VRSKAMSSKSDFCIWLMEKRTIKKNGGRAAV